MTDENDVDVVLFELVDIDILVLGPFTGHQSLEVDFWITFSDDDLFFLFDNNGLFDFNRLFVFGFIFFLLFIKSEIMTFLNLLNVFDLNFVEILANRVCGSSISFHRFIEKV